MPEPRARRRLTAAAIVIVGAAAVIVIIAVRFPYADSLTRAAEQSGWSIRYANEQRHFPFGSELTDVRALNPSAGALGDLRSTLITVEPIFSFEALRPAVRLTALIFNGDASATMAHAAGANLVSFDASSIDLSELHILDQFALTADGKLRAAGKYRQFDAAEAPSAGNCIATIEDFNLRPPAPYPAAGFGRVESSLALAGNVIRIERLSSSGGDLSIDGSGEIVLGQSSADSRLDLTFSLAIAPEAGGRVGILVAALPHPPAEGAYHLTGTIASPRLD
jgi:type II secretion system protein N